MDEITRTENNIELSEAQRLDYEIKTEAHNIAGSILRIGRALKRMNERGLYKTLGYESLGEYSSAAVGLQERAAYNYIKCYDTYGADFLEKHERLGLTKLVALTQLNDEDRNELLDSGNVEKMTVRELKEEVKRYKDKCEQLTFELEEQKTPVEVLPKPEMTAAEIEEIRKSKGATITEGVTVLIIICLLIVFGIEITKMCINVTKREERTEQERTEDVAPVVQSKWEINCDGYYPYCLNCGDEPPGRIMTDYCPNCGAKMKARTNEKND